MTQPADRSPAAAPAPAPPARGVGRHALVYGAGLVFNRLVSFLMLPVYTRFLVPADYGLLQLLMLTMDLVALLAGARLATGIFYHYNVARDDAERRSLLATALVTLAGSYAVMGVLTGLAAVPLASLVFHDPGRAMLVRLAAVAFVFEGVNLVALTTLQVERRSTRYVGATAIKLLMQVALNLLALGVLHLGVEGMMGATALANATMATVLGSELVRRNGRHFDPAQARALLRFGVPLMATQMATLAITSTDRYMLNAAAGAAAVGLYSIAYQFGVLPYSLGFSPINQVWEPMRYAIADRPDRDALYARAFTLTNLVVLTFAVAVVLGVRDYLRLATPPDYHIAWKVVPVIAAAYLLQSWSDLHCHGAMMRKRTELLTAANWTAAAVAVAGYFALIPRLAALGAALPLAIAYAVRSAIVYAGSQRLWPVRYDWPPVLRQFLFAALTCGVAFALPEWSLWRDIPLHLALFATYLVLVWTMGGLRPGDRDELAGRLGALLRRLRGRPPVDAGVAA